MRTISNIQDKYSKYRTQNSAFSKMQALQYDEEINSAILLELTPYAKGKAGKTVPAWYTAWCKAPLAVRGQALYIEFTKHKLTKNIHPTHIKALIAVMSFESQLLPLVINSGTDGLNSNLINNGQKGGAAFGLDQRISSRKYDLLNKIHKVDSSIFDIAIISKVVDFILNDINSNPDLASYKANIMKTPGTVREEILQCVQLYEGLSATYASQWKIAEREANYNLIFR